MPIKGRRISILENSRDAMRDRSKGGFYERDRGDLFIQDDENRRNGGQEHGNHSCEDGWLLLWREAGSEKVYDQIATGKKQIYTYGPIIHNEEVVQDLEEKGVQVINSKEELEALKEGVVVIRSHGVGREIYELLERQGLEFIDLPAYAVGTDDDHTFFQGFQFLLRIDDLYAPSLPDPAPPLKLLMMGPSRHPVPSLPSLSDHIPSRLPASRQSRSQPSSQL